MAHTYMYSQNIVNVLIQHFGLANISFPSKSFLAIYLFSYKIAQKTTHIQLIPCNLDAPTRGDTIHTIGTRDGLETR